MLLGKSSEGSLCTNEAESQDTKRKNGAGVFSTIIHGAGQLFLQRPILEITVPLRSSISSVLSSPAQTPELTRTLVLPTEPGTPGASETGAGGCSRVSLSGQPQALNPHCSGLLVLLVLYPDLYPQAKPSLQSFPPGVCRLRPAFPTVSGSQLWGWAPFQKYSPCDSASL